MLTMFAIEDEPQGGLIATAYVAANKVQCWIPGRGDIVNALLANGETAVIGSFLESNGDGTLRVHVPDDASANSIQPVDFTGYTNVIVGVATEANDMSSSSGADSPRIAVRII